MSKFILVDVNYFGTIRGTYIAQLVLYKRSLLIMTKLFSATLFIVVVFSWCGSSIAATHEHHTTHHSVSPFDKKKERHSLHCALKGHRIDQVCPEISLNNTIIKEKISADCGNHTSSSHSDVGASSSINLLTSNIRPQNSFLLTGQQSNLHNQEVGHSFSESIDHPPQDTI